MAKVSIVGAGNVGATAGFVMLMNKVADIVLVDIVDAVKGKELDMWQAGTVENFENTIKGTTDFSEIKDSDVVVITAGKPRTPDIKTRENLLAINEKIVGSVLEHIKQHCPDAIIIIVTNPLDLLVDFVIKQGFDKKKVIGQSGALDSTRFMTFMGKGSEGMVIGYHSDDMIPVVSQAKINGQSALEVLGKEKMDAIVARTKKGGAEITKLVGTSAFYAPGSAISQMVDSIVNDKNAIIPCCVAVDSQYGLNDVCLGLPVKLDKNGAEIVEIPLSEDEMAQLKASVEKRKK
jgi:malate dehydrogenase